MLKRDVKRRAGALSSASVLCPLPSLQAASACPLIAMNPELLNLLVTREMPFGKYKGRLIADLPGNYLAWFAREGFPPGELGRLLALMLELDHNGLKPLLDPLRKGRAKASGE